jgi:probable HAF family extracellular repeat protein
MRHGFNLLALLFLLLVWSGSSLHATTYQMRYLDMPEGSTGEPRAINDLGQVVGEIWGLPVPTVALWDSAGRLSMPISGTAWAYDISNSGEIVGEFAGSDGYSHPYLWTPEIGTRDLSADLSPTSYVWRIGAGGRLVGNDHLAWPNSRGFVWDSAAGVTYLPTADYLSSQAADVSDSGVVAGTVVLQDHTKRAFMWSADNGLTLILPDGPPNVASAISSGGVILGASELGNGSAERFIWSAELGKVPMCVSTEEDYLSVLAVNDAGMVVGTMRYQDYEQMAFVWSKDSGFTMLGEGVAYDINNAGSVLGWVGSPQYDQVVVWESVPEPSSLIALGMGILPLVRVFTRRRV